MSGFGSKKSFEEKIEQLQKENEALLFEEEMEQLQKENKALVWAAGQSPETYGPIDLLRRVNDLHKRRVECCKHHGELAAMRHFEKLLAAGQHLLGD
jgi:hypothetical protein